MADEGEAPVQSSDTAPPGEPQDSGDGFKGYRGGFGGPPPRGRGFMRGPRSGMHDGLSNKDQLFNDLVDEFQQRQLDFPKDSAKKDGSYFLQVLCNALWYITNCHVRIHEESMRRKNVFDVPKCFDKFQHYDDTRKKKMKSRALSSDGLTSHAEALYSLLLKPIIGSTPAWSVFQKDLQKLADCMISYKTFLVAKCQEINNNHSLDHPCKPVAEYTTVEHRAGCMAGELNEHYKKLDRALKSGGESSFVYFSEAEHLSTPFQNNQQRYRFFKELRLSMPIDIYRYCPGGSSVASYCIAYSKENRSIQELLVEGARFVLKNKQYFREYHTRSMKRVFKEKVNNIGHISPSVLELIYTELTLDASASSHPDMQERLRLISLGETDLIADLRHCNPGRPSDHFDIFFQQLALLVEESTAADERRHGTAHLSEWISLSDMIKKAEERCPENTPIPSKALVRLQFAPRNPYAHSAWSFTSKIDVQYKIQRRQLRCSHPDEHYCNALFKYLKERAIELDQTEGACVALFSCDDKAKVPIGEPGFSVSTGVRGKKSIAPTGTTLVAGDHDMTKSSLTPSVTLDIKIPAHTEDSFVRGKVTVTVNDSVFQTSSPFRHAVFLSRLLEGREINVLLKYTDGGVDHRNTLESVKCACICLFKERNLDMLILCRCAPGHSWRNPAERVMSILNLGLQNCSLEREKMDENSEKLLKKCGSMSEIREMSVKEPALKKEYAESVEKVQSLIQKRFRRLKLKEDQIATADPVKDEEIENFKGHLKEMFPELDLGKIQKAKTEKVKSYVTWKDRHCKERQYSFQIRKCTDPTCCSPPSCPDEKLVWLPDPVLKDNDHFKTYAEINGSNTTEEDRPTFQKSKAKAVNSKAGSKRKAASTPLLNIISADEDIQGDGFYFSAQTARTTVRCCECQKPRIIYCKLKLSGRQEVQLAQLMSSYEEYSCGSPLTPPGHALHGKALVHLNIDCSSPIEVPYFSAELGPKDICYYCGGENANIDLELKKQFKTVLPVCELCIAKDLTSPCMRPYGKPKKTKK